MPAPPVAFLRGRYLHIELENLADATGCFRVPLIYDLCPISAVSGPIPKSFGMVNPTMGRFDKMHMKAW